MRQLVPEDKQGLLLRERFIRQIERRPQEPRQHRAVRCGRDNQRDVPPDAKRLLLLLKHAAQGVPLGSLAGLPRQVNKTDVAICLPAQESQYPRSPQDEHHFRNREIPADRHFMPHLVPPVHRNARRSRFVRCRSLRRGLHLFPRRHIHCNRPDRRDLHRCIRKRQLHRDQQPDREQRPNKADGPRRIAFFHDPPQQEQHQRCRRHGQSNLHHIIDQSAPTDWEHILPLQSYRPCASRKARRSSMSCSVSAPASDRLATRFFTEPPHSRRTKLVLSRCR